MSKSKIIVRFTVFFVMFMFISTEKQGLINVIYLRVHYVVVVMECQARKRRRIYVVNKTAR
ncbi:hypothetical protein AALP_AA8G341500 [Arabis alpina]|uniref:Uncharacterized protein n=1 Tax=Arabis alpina TaxID=50452 RepID=A0A087GB96_ARAAL|nr:hypothetical protein AALP_AA8G341500 [Arabis alpina]